MLMSNMMIFFVPCNLVHLKRIDSLFHVSMGGGVGGEIAALLLDMTQAIIPNINPTPGTTGTHDKMMADRPMYHRVLLPCAAPTVRPLVPP